MPPHKLQKFDSKHVSAGIFGGVETVMDKGATEKMVEEDHVVRVKVEKDDSTGTMQNAVVKKALDNGDQKTELRAARRKVEHDPARAAIGAFTNCRMTTASSRDLRADLVFKHLRHAPQAIIQ